jgi:hypothetical protein
MPNIGMSTDIRVNFRNARRLSVEFNLRVIEVSSGKTHYAHAKTGGASQAAYVAGILAADETRCNE